MRVLEYVGLDAQRVAAAYAKVSAALSRGDFRSAEVKKLTGHTRLYRARLDHSNRLLFTLLRAGGEVCVLNLEIIHQHAYEKSRFLRGAEIDESKIADTTLAAEEAAAQPQRYLHPERGFERKDYAQGPLAALFERIAPPHVDAQAGERLVRVDRRQAEYLLLQSLWVLLSRAVRLGQRGITVDSQRLLDCWQHFPPSVLPATRNRRQHISSVLSRNEIGSSYPYSCAIFRRYAHGHYQLDLLLRLRQTAGDAEP